MINQVSVMFLEKVKELVRLLEQPSLDLSCVCDAFASLLGATECQVHQIKYLHYELTLVPAPSFSGASPLITFPLMWGTVFLGELRCSFASSLPALSPEQQFQLELVLRVVAQRLFLRSIHDCLWEKNLPALFAALQQRELSLPLLFAAQFFFHLELLEPHVAVLLEWKSRREQERASSLAHLSTRLAPGLMVPYNESQVLCLLPGDIHTVCDTLFHLCEEWERDDHLLVHGVVGPETGPDTSYRESFADAQAGMLCKQDLAPRIVRSDELPLEESVSVYRKCVEYLAAQRKPSRNWVRELCAIYDHLGNVQTAGKALGIHPNTLQKRKGAMIETVKTLYGFDLEEPPHWQAVYAELQAVLREP